MKTIERKGKPLDLWRDLVAVADLLQLWEDVLLAAGGGMGP